MPKTRVLVLCGGQSGEHDVSLASARSVVKAAGNQFEVTPLVIDQTGMLLTAKASQNILEFSNSAVSSESHALTSLGSQGFDVVFPLLHGPNGEDGSVQGMLKLMGLPFVGSGILGSAVGMDKLMMKAIYKAHGLKQVNYQDVKRSDWQNNPSKVLEQLSTLKHPLFVKPANLGSSVGISKTRNEAELISALNEAAKHDRRIIVEEGLQDARELEVGILGNDNPQASVVGEISFSSDFYDYDTKYTDGQADLHIPANIPQAISEQCQELALNAFNAIDAAGIARVDFLYSDQTNELYLNEINTMPGFTTTSMYPKLWEASGVTYSELIQKLIELALEQR